MVNLEIAHQRLKAQHICGDRSSTPLETVESLGAVQAQDYPSAMWAIGLRTQNATFAMVERSISEKMIVRSALFRNTLHLVPATDLRWMLKLTSAHSRIFINRIARANGLDLNEDLIERSQDILSTTLHGGKLMTRDDLGASLQENGVPTKGLARLLILQRAQADGLICYGPRQGRQQVFTLIEEWLPRVPDLENEEALERLSLQYFRGHGPATLHDFSWWSGLGMSEARRGLGMVHPKLHSEQIGDQIYWSGGGSRPDCGRGTGLWLLPNFDEYTVGYKDRSAVFDERYESKALSARGHIPLENVIVLNGEIVGVWKRRVEKETVRITAQAFKELDPEKQKQLKMAIEEQRSFFSGSLPN
jgi:hypothetical protein